MTEKILQNCTKCGMCLNVCPIYSTLNEEQASPRARMHLITSYEQNSLQSSVPLKEIISKCLMCGSCSPVCPSGIKHYSKFMEMRKKMAQDHGETIPIKSLVYLLAKEQRLRFATRIAKMGLNIIPEKFKETYKLGAIPLKRFPTLNKKPFRSCIPNAVPPKGDQKGTVLYFTGCATNYMYDDTGYSTLNLLTRLGYQVIIPENQTCCAIPLLFHGAIQEAKKNIQTNIAALSREPVDAIIVDCATCGTALKNEYSLLSDELNLDNTAVERISSLVVDIVSFISDKIDSLEFKEKKDSNSVNVTYHLPCHLKNSFGNRKNMSDLLNAIPNINYIKADDFDSCCGGGGTFFYEYPDISRIMADKKKENAKKTRAALWLTDCPVCRINLSGNLSEDEPIKVIHPVKIINGLLKETD